MFWVIDEDVSSTSTISSGVVAVEDKFDVEESAVSAVKNAEPSAFVTVMLLLVMESVVTDLSVQMRPTLAVLPLMRPSQSQMVSGSAIELVPSAIAAAMPELEVPAAASAAEGARQNTISTVNRRPSNRFLIVYPLS